MYFMPTVPKMNDVDFFLFAFYSLPLFIYKRTASHLFSCESSNFLTCKILEMFLEGSKSSYFYKS